MPERGLPAPDAVIFLQLSAEAAKGRGGYGDEIYERVDFQNKVRVFFRALDLRVVVFPFPVYSLLADVQYLTCPCVIWYLRILSSCVFAPPGGVSTGGCRVRLPPHPGMESPRCRP